MKKLLRKLFLYLFKEDFQRMKALERDLEGLIHRQNVRPLWLRFVLNVSENFWGTSMFRSMFITIQAHGLSCPYRVERRTILNSLTSTKEALERFLLSYDSLTGRMLRLTPTPLIEKC